MGRKEELLPASYSERKREATSWVTWRDKQPRSDADPDVEKLELVGAAGGNVKWCHFDRKQFGGASEN